jgi:ketosteroid isomerase-like protein
MMHGAGGRAPRAAETETRRRVHELVQLRMAGQIDRLMDFFVEDVELRYNCSKAGIFPVGFWQGQSALREYLRRTDIDYEPLAAEVQDVFVEGDRTAVRWTGRFRRRANGRVYEIDLAHFIRWRKDRIARLDEFVDDHVVSRAAGPLQSFEDMMDPPGPGLSRDEMARRFMALGNFSRSGPDIGLFRRYCAPDVVSEFVGDRNAIFYAGRHRGIEALTNIIRAINIDFEQVGSTTPEMVVDGSGVAARRTVEWRHRGTGLRGLVELADFVRFQNGLIVELVEFRDSVALLQMQG